MDTLELIKKVRKVEIKTRGISTQLFSGEYKSAFKGRGMSFSEVREYQHGDDIRLIDWNVTARLDHPYIKVFEEERELTVMLLVDASASENFGTNKQLKKDLIIEMSAVLSFSAIQNNDKVGLIIFTDSVEKFIPPKKGKTHILRIIRELINFEPASKKTNIDAALRHFNGAIKKRCTAFLISDLISPDYSQSLKIASKKHDLVALRIFDDREMELPNIGLAKFYNAESGEYMWIDTSDKKSRENFRKNALVNEIKLKDMFAKNGTDYVKIATGHSYIQPLMDLFKKRGSK